MSKMNIIIGNPPNIKQLEILFKIDKNTIFTYGDTIYNPGDNFIDKPLMAHEEVHAKQQGDNPKLWWKKYIASPDFRLSQEVEAYQVQYRTAKKLNNDRNQLSKYASRLAADLSGKLYGSIISHGEAYAAITSLKTYKFNT